MEKQGFIDAVESLFSSNIDVLSNLISEFHSEIDKLDISEAAQKNRIKIMVKKIAEDKASELEEELLNNKLLNYNNPSLTENQLREMRLEEFVWLEIMCKNFFIDLTNFLNSRVTIYLGYNNSNILNRAQLIEANETENKKNNSSTLDTSKNSSFVEDTDNQLIERDDLLFHMSIDGRNELAGCG
jgi:hypothetical protein